MSNPYAENTTPIKNGETRWYQGRKRVTVVRPFDRFAKVRPWSQYLCEKPSGTQVLHYFSDLLTRDAALKVAREQKPLVLAEANAAVGLAEEWDQALKEIEAEVHAEQEAARGNLDNFRPVMRDVDERIMTFLPSDATGYVLVVQQAPNNPGGLFATSGDRIVSLYGVFLGGEISVDTEPIYNDFAFGLGSDFARGPDGHITKVQAKSGRPLSMKPHAFIAILSADDEELK